MWTTTPWTLVSNMAIMVHPIYTYVRVKVDDETWIVAKERLDHLMRILGRSAVIAEELPGKKLKGSNTSIRSRTRYTSTMSARCCLSEEYVTLEDGTGPGAHARQATGPADFVMGKRFGVEVFCPVDGTGKFTEGAGQEWAGKTSGKRSATVIAVMKENGSLVHEAQRTPTATRTAGAARRRSYS